MELWQALNMLKPCYHCRPYVSLTPYDTYRDKDSILLKGFEVQWILCTKLWKLCYTENPSENGPLKASVFSTYDGPKYYTTNN